MRTLNRKERIERYIRRLVLFGIWGIIMYFVAKQWNITHMAAEDVTAPIVSGVEEFSPEKQVCQAGSLAINAQISDEEGLLKYKVTMMNLSGTEIPFEYMLHGETTLSQLTVAIPSDFPVDTYQVTDIEVTDINGNVTDYRKNVNNMSWYSGDELVDVQAELRFQVVYTEQGTTGETDTSVPEPTTTEQETTTQKIPVTEQTTTILQQTTVTPQETTKQPTTEAKKDMEIVSITESVGDVHIALPSAYTVLFSANIPNGLARVQILLAENGALGESGRFTLYMPGQKTLNDITIEIPEKCLSSGIYHVAEIVLTDQAGDTISYYRQKDEAGEYGSQWYKSGSAVSGLSSDPRVEITGISGDVDGPKLTAVSGIQFQNSADGKKLLTLSAEIQDESGIASLIVNFTKRNNNLAARTAYLEFNGEQSLSTVQFVLEKGMLEEASYILDKIICVDTLGNTSIYTYENNTWYNKGEIAVMDTFPLYFKYEEPTEETTTVKQTTAATTAKPTTTKAVTTTTKAPTTQQATTRVSSQISATSQTVLMIQAQEETTAKATYRAETSVQYYNSGANAAASAEETTTLAGEEMTTAAQEQMIEEQVVVDAFASPNERGEAVIDIGTNQNLPVKAFELLKDGENTNMKLVATNYIWLFRKQDLTDISVINGFFNAGILTGEEAKDTETDEYIDANLKNKDLLKFQMKYRSQFPGMAQIAVAWKEEFAGKTAYVYMMNNGVPVLQTTSIVDEEGAVTFTTDFGFKGFLSLEELTDTVEEDEASGLLDKAIAEAKDLSNNKMKQGYLIIIGAVAVAVVLCIIVVISGKKAAKKRAQRQKEEEL